VNKQTIIDTKEPVLSESEHGFGNFGAEGSSETSSDGDLFKGNKNYKKEDTIMSEQSKSSLNMSLSRSVHQQSSKIITPLAPVLVIEDDHAPEIDQFLQNKPIKEFGR